MLRLASSSMRASGTPPAPTPLLSSSPRPNGKASISNYPPASRIFVRNLSYSTDEATLIKLFSRYGQVVEVKLAKHEETKKSKGYAFVQYLCQDDAVVAMEQVDQKVINGRVVHAEIAKPLHTGFAAYPITSGPPLQKNSEADVFEDQ